MEKSESTAVQSIQRFRKSVAQGATTDTGTDRMDQELKPASGTATVRSVWETDFLKLLEIYDKLEFPSYLEIYLPFGWSQFRTPSSQFIEFSGVVNHEFNELARYSQNEYMRLFIQNIKGRKRLGLKQTFYKPPTAGHINKERGFSYQWTDKKTTISSALGTTDIKKVKTQIHRLLNECRRFLFMYCTIEVPKKKR